MHTGPLPLGHAEISRQCRQEAREALDREAGKTNEDTVTEAPTKGTLGCDAFSYDMRERGMDWQKLERLTSEKETKKNWISARLLMLPQSQAFPKSRTRYRCRKTSKKL